MSTASNPDPSTPPTPQPAPRSAAPARTSYLALLRMPGAAGFFTAASTGRLGITMTSLGLVWLLHAATGSYAVAGVAVGAFALAEALVGPQVARLVDAYGQTRVLPVLVGVHAAAMATVITAVTAQGDAGVVVLVAVVVAGASAPQLGALSAARWVHLLHRQPSHDAPSVLPAAFALESVANAGAYLVGPVAVSAVAATGRPALGSTTAAALVVTGSLALAAQRASAPPAAGARPRRRRGGAGRPLLSRAFVVLVAVNVGMGAYFGALQVAVPAFTTQAGRSGAAPALFAVGSVTGLLAVWVYGRRTWRAPHHRQLAIATTVLAVGSALLIGAGDVVQLGLLLAATGAVVPVVLVLSSVLTQARVERAVLTQAFTWLSSASAAGLAGAVGIAGIAIDATGARGGLAVATIATAAIAVVVISAPRALSGPPTPTAAGHDSEPGDGDRAGGAER